MKYSWKFKLECVEKYKKGVRISKPDFSNCDAAHFTRQVLNWVKLFDAHGINGLKHKSSNKDWTQEERFELIAKVLAGHSQNSVAYEAGINSGLLCSWIKKYKQEGYYGLKCKRRGRPPKEISSMPKPNNNSDTKLTLSEKEELKLLRQRNEYLEAENAYLKKVKALAIEKMASSAKAKKQKPSKSSLKKDTD